LLTAAQAVYRSEAYGRDRTETASALAEAAELTPVSVLGPSWSRRSMSLCPWSINV